MIVRPYKNSDYSELCSWIGLQLPEGMLVENGTFILELDNVPALTLTVFLTQSKQIAYLEGFNKNPLFKERNLETEGQKLWDHCFNFAREQGYARLLCCAEARVDKLKAKYQRFGMTKTIDLTGFVKEL